MGLEQWRAAVGAWIQLAVAVLFVMLVGVFSVVLSLRIIAGDVELNPGPPKGRTCMDRTIYMLCSGHKPTDMYFEGREGRMYIHAVYISLRTSTLREEREECTLISNLLLCFCLELP